MVRRPESTTLPVPAGCADLTRKFPAMPEEEIAEKLDRIIELLERIDLSLRAVATIVYDGDVEFHATQGAVERMNGR